MGVKRRPAFDVRAYLDSVGIRSRVTTRQRRDVIFSQGDLCDHVFIIETGSIKLAVTSRAGKEAVVAMLGPGDFVGEGALAGQPLRIATATAMAESRLLAIDKQEMLGALHEHADLADHFLAYMLARNIQIQADLVDQLFNSSEKRLARTLLLLARFGKEQAPHRVLPNISQETLAEMVGTTRSRVNFFMNKFRKLGFIEYNGELRINDSLVSVMLHD